jgi:hypothetical protein
MDNGFIGTPSTAMFRVVGIIEIEIAIGIGIGIDIEERKS